MRALALSLFFAGAIFAADTSAGKWNLSQSQIDDIIQKFSAKESAFAKARDNYTYRQTASIQEADGSGTPGGRWEEVTDITFTPSGERTEHVVHAPVPTLHLIIMDPGDIEDMRHTQPFVLTSEELPNYWVRYLGHQQVDEIGCYVFAVKPKKMEQNKRYFSGEVWVDDQELQIVKSYGRGVGLERRGEDHQYPKFETYREQIDGKYWFPTYTIANDTLHFKDNDVRIKQVIRYEDYKQFKSDVKITYGDEADKKDDKKDDKKKQ